MNSIDLTPIIDGIERTHPKVTEAVDPGYKCGACGATFQTARLNREGFKRCPLCKSMDIGKVKDEKTPKQPTA